MSGRRKYEKREEYIARAIRNAHSIGGPAFSVAAGTAAGKGVRRDWVERGSQPSAQSVAERKFMAEELLKEGDQCYMACPADERGKRQWNARLHCHAKSLGMRVLMSTRGERAGTAKVVRIK